MTDEQFKAIMNVFQGLVFELIRVNNEQFKEVINYFIELEDDRKEDEKTLKEYEIKSREKIKEKFIQMLEKTGAMAEMIKGFSNIFNKFAGIPNMNDETASNNSK